MAQTTLIVWYVSTLPRGAASIRAAPVTRGGSACGGGTHSIATAGSARTIGIAIISSLMSWSLLGADTYRYVAWRHLLITAAPLFASRAARNRN